MKNRTTWVIDPTHSEILFKVKHLMITSVKGEFRSFAASVISTGQDFKNASVKVTIDPASIFTNQEDRDAHLRSADFFDTEKYAEITFEGTSFTRLDDENYHLKGLLIMKGMSKEILLDVEFGGFVTDPYGNAKAGFSVHGKINRKDWGLNWNAALETGGVLVSDEVRISAEIQLVAQNEVAQKTETVVTHEVDELV